MTPEQIKERARQVTLARKWLDEQQVLTVEGHYYKEEQEDQFHLALKDAKGNHLLDSKRAHWAWYEGTVEHRNSVADRIAELLVDYSAAAMTEADAEARLEEACLAHRHGEWHENERLSCWLCKRIAELGLRVVLRERRRSPHEDRKNRP